MCSKTHSPAKILRKCLFFSGSLLIAITILIFTFLFSLYGAALIRVLSRTITLPSYGHEDKSELAHKFTMVCVVISSSFFLETIIVIVFSRHTNAFFNVFLLFQGLFILIDGVMLFGVLYLFQISIGKLLKTHRYVAHNNVKDLYNRRVAAFSCQGKNKLAYEF